MVPDLNHHPSATRQQVTALIAGRVTRCIRADAGDLMECPVDGGPL